MIGGKIVIEACANEGVGANEQVVRRLPGRRPYFHTSVRASFQLYNFRLSVLTFILKLWRLYCCTTFNHVGTSLLSYFRLKSGTPTSCITLHSSLYQRAWITWIEQKLCTLWSAGIYQRQSTHCACDPQYNRRPHRRMRPSTEHTLPWFAFTNVDACNSEQTVLPIVAE